MKKIIILLSFCLILLIGSSFVLEWSYERKMQSDGVENLIVDLNEVEQLMVQDKKKEAVSKIHLLQGKTQEKQKRKSRISFKGGVQWIAMNMGALLLLFLFLYFRLLRPFARLEKYASEIAQGNLDLPLQYERGNPFGEFTWAFDHMRIEMKRAKKAEEEAIENHKTVIATLSHDIKTPLASVITYAEALEANLDSNIERRKKYVSVIIRKCNEVSKLTNDLFLHSLSDLKKLQIVPKKIEIQILLKELLAEHSLQGALEEAVVLADERRFVQAIENIINNAEKYGNTKVLQWYTRKQDGYYVIGFQDFGPGIPDKDMPFIMEKFYRGSNVENQPGAGLGLFITSYVLEQMGGKVTMKNIEQGLNTEVFLKIS